MPTWGMQNDMGAAQQATNQAPSQHAARTRVVLFGTGTPVPDPDRSGPATAIVVDDRAYLIDFGPGIVRRAESAALNRKISAVEPGNLKVAFVTHLHSDHTAGYSDLILTGWTSGRTVPLEVYGPPGMRSMTEHILEAYRVDIETRTNPDGNQRRFPDGATVNAHEVKPGVIYKDEKVTVSKLHQRLPVPLPPEESSLLESSTPMSACPWLQTRTRCSNSA